jgi:hypothetical protein
MKQTCAEAFDLAAQNGHAEACKILMAGWAEHWTVGAMLHFCTIRKTKPKVPILEIIAGLETFTPRHLEVCKVLLAGGASVDECTKVSDIKNVQVLMNETQFIDTLYIETFTVYLLNRCFHLIISCRDLLPTH